MKGMVFVLVLSVVVMLPSAAANGAELYTEQVPWMIYPHNTGGVATIGDQLYVWAGIGFGTRQSYLEVYDPSSCAWTELASAPPANGRSGFGDFALDGELYMIGGESGTAGGSFHSTVFKFTPGSGEPGSGTWSQLNSFPTNIWDPMTVVCDGRAFVIGGRHGYGQTYDHVYEYDPAGDAWIVSAPMPYDVFLAATVCYDGRIYVFGGNNKPNEGTNTWGKTIQIYDPATDTWESCPDPMPWQPYRAQAVVYDGVIHLFTRRVWDDDEGGYVDNNYVYLFHPESGTCTGTWEQHEFFTLYFTSYSSRLGLIGSQVYFTNTFDDFPHAGNMAYRAALPVGTPTNVDGDGIPAECDNCPYDWNPGQEDSDGDGVGDVCDGAAICGDNVVNRPSEQCDGTDDADCPGQCLPPGDTNECRCPICGDNVVNQPDEECDGTDDSACPGQCRADCTCPPPEAIPTVSEWGLVILALFLITGAKMYFGRRRLARM